METIDALKERRSVNFFDNDKSITDEKIDELLSMANLSPSSFNLQPWEVVVVKDPERKKVLRKCAFDQPKVEEASVVLIIIANPNAVEENLDNVIKSMVDLGYIKEEAVESTRQMPYNLYDEKETLKRKFFAIKNAAFFAMSIMIGAKGLGLESHPMDGFTEDMIKKEFNIPEDRIIPLILAIGYPKPGLELLQRSYRRDLKDFVHIDNY